MIQVTIYQNKNQEFTGFRMDGHADYAEEGQDIVCAAVSMLAINTVNAIEAFTEDKAEVESEDGYLSCLLKDSPSEKASLLMKTLVLGLESLSDDETYETYIDLLFEEV